MTVELHTRQIQPLRNTYAHVAKYVGDGKPASRYQEATLDTQPTENFHYRPTWDPEHELFDKWRTKVKLADRNMLSDPRRQDAGEISLVRNFARGTTKDNQRTKKWR